MSIQQKAILHIVTGAPGAGKSSALAAFLDLKSEFIAFDIDWLTLTASNLAGRDIIFDRSTWRPYNALWFEILHAIQQNNRIPVLFAPTDPHDVAMYGQPVWCDEMRWLLLDCDDDLRRRRLCQRPAWTAAMIEEAVADAAALRQMVHLSIDTGALPAQAVATRIRDWLVQSQAWRAEMGHGFGG